MPFHPDDPLEVCWGDGHHWVVRRGLHWTDPETEWLVNVPAGFTTDFASVPRAFWSVFPPTGRYGPAAVLHDYLYVRGCVWDATGVERPISRGYADSVLRRASGDLGVPWRVRWPMYLGVRAGAWGAWRRHRTRDAE